MTLENIDNQIDKLNERIKNIESRPTEVYSRIVGYYRSVKNWNNGKSAEYKVRKTFMEPELKASQPPILNVQKEEAPREEEVRKEAVEEMMAVDSVSVEKPAVVHEDQADLFALEAELSEKTAPVTYSFFYRNTCPNCPPVKELLGNLDWKGEHINVDEEEGLNAAVQYNVFTAPTVILFSPEGNEIFRTDNAKGLGEFVEAGAEAVTTA
ncbi:MAG: hypothetical protein JXA95_04110 [Spirochaetales bacterium]|nr:hypothetical protein [Spirochaetales bacterium]